MPQTLYQNKMDATSDKYTNPYLWRLVEQRLTSGEKGCLTQFCIDNNFPHKSNGPDGKYYLRFYSKITGLKELKLTAEQRQHVINVGKSSGVNLLEKKNQHQIPQSDTTTIVQNITNEKPGKTIEEPIVQPDTQTQNPLEILAELPVPQRTMVLKIMKGMPESDLLSVIRLVKANL